MEKKIEKYVFHSCAYTLIISVLFFVFAAVTGMENISISIGRYFLIVGFSILITVAELIFKVKSINKFISYLIHFSALFVSFLVVFILVNDQDFKPSFIFSSLVIFTLCYFAVFGINVAYKKLRNKVGKTLENKQNEQNEKPKYTSRFS